MAIHWWGASDTVLLHVSSGEKLVTTPGCAADASQNLPSLLWHVKGMCAPCTRQVSSLARTQLLARKPS
eukprot:1159425-Pelagomonas_calceolata.AAC.6